jgi:5-methylcytosine-specific restriction endonuclease McrA/ribosomal protein S27E
MTYAPRQPAVEIPCSYCGDFITMNANRLRVKKARNPSGDVFCTPGCFHQHRWAGRRSVKVSCLYCNAEIIKEQNRIDRVKYGAFCNHDCFNLWRSANMTGEKSPAWKGGKTLNYVGGGWKLARRAARERDKNTCRCCLRRQLPTERAFDVHHVKPYEQFADPWEANKLDNLLTLCRSCHGKFNPHYKGEPPVISGTFDVLLLEEK